MTEILQTRIPHDVLSPRPLPGIAPLAMADWLDIDEAYAGQMGARRRLLREARGTVLACEEGALAAAREVLDLVLEQLEGRAGFRRDGTVMHCPDGAEVTLDRDDPLATLGRIVQEDFCILHKRGTEHVLTAAVLCFPASWSLAEKFQRPLIGIHRTVESYDDGLAKRVQRLFDGVKPGRPLWRFNALWYQDPALHQPRTEDDPRRDVSEHDGPYMRSERQCILRLPQSRAVVFSIHTYLLRREALGR
ncbi:Protein of unknown function [Salinihabitans flavidus]|uniref:DUF3445 domain-containing protein n=1 Tax=Salinihabitans flavidus TaxID=569882 RepID=A0A1H8RMU1_9RHOB|nr:DUF3445 domain-containing protein [Salinihabitans flavidus]SEO67652.1 Protein of unknown function [Salinihabitans flavidus]